MQDAWAGCAYCGATDTPLQRDCVLPISRGGRYTLDNVVPACRSCNTSKCNDEVTGWLLRKRLDERTFLLRYLDIRTTLVRRALRSGRGIAYTRVVTGTPQTTDYAALGVFACVASSGGRKPSRLPEVMAGVRGKCRRRGRGSLNVGGGQDGWRVHRLALPRSDVDQEAVADSRDDIGVPPP